MFFKFSNIITCLFFLYIFFISTTLVAQSFFDEAFRPEGIKLTYGGVKYSESIKFKNNKGAKYEKCSSEMEFLNGDTKDSILNSNSLENMYYPISKINNRLGY